MHAPFRCASLWSAILLQTAVTLSAQVWAPTIHTVGVDDGENLRPGSTFTLRFNASAGSLPLESAAFGFRTPDGIFRRFTTSSPGTGVISLPVTNDWPNGEYRLESVTLTSGHMTSNFFSNPIGAGAAPLVPPGTSETLFLTRFIVTGSTAFVRPTLAAVTRVGAAEVQAGRTVTFRFAFTPASAAVRRTGISIEDSNGAVITASSGDDPTQITLEVPAHSVNGRYTVRFASVSDAAEQLTVFYRTGQINSTPGPVVHAIDFNTADFTVADGLDSFTFPLLESFVLRTASASVSDTVAIDHVVTPGSRPLKSVTFILNGPAGITRVRLTGTAATGAATFVVPSTLVSGRYVLDRIEIVDAGNYQTFYQSNRIVGFSPSRPRPPSSHNFNFATHAVNITGGIAPIPVILEQPRDVSADPGRFAELKITAHSPAGWTVRWYEGAAGDTSKPTIWNSSSFSVQATTDTSYWARVSNAYGSVDSRAASITPRFSSPLPQVFRQPSPVSYAVGNRASLEANVVGPGPMSYVWHKDGVPIPGATEPRLDLGVLTAAMSGTYHLVVSNAHGSVQTNAVQVIAKERPRIVAQTRSQRVRRGQRVTFNVEATGGDLQYSWGKNNATFGGSPNGSTYTIENVQPHDAGSYGVYITNDQGSVTAENIVLTVDDPDLPPPQFVNLPDVHYASVGSAFGFFVYAINGPERYTVSSPLPPGVAWNEREGHFLGPITAAGDYRVTFTATNATGTTSRTITIRVFDRQAAPIFVTQPQSQTVHVDERVTLSADVRSLPIGFSDNTRYQWKKDGVALFERAGPTLEIYAVRLGDAGSYTLEVTNNAGITVSQPAVLTVLPAVAPPTITMAPQSQVVPPGASVTFSVTAQSAAPLSYQWLRNGVAIPGATAASLRLDAVEVPQSGSYTVRVTSRAGSVTSAAATLTLDEIIPGHLKNISVRSFTAPGERTLIAGFAVNGARSKPLLVRVVGPSLRNFGVPGAMADPKLSIVRAERTVDVNDNWTSSNITAAIANAAARVGAFALPTHAADSATLLALESGAYSVVGASAGPGSGTALIELYDADETFGRVSARLVNVSARSHVSTGADVLIAGFVIAGDRPCRLLIRGIGPGLEVFGLARTLAAPRLQLYRGSSLMAENTRWTAQAESVASASQSVGAFALQPASQDAAFVTSLPAGAYSVILSGVNDATGVGLIEIYALP